MVKKMAKKRKGNEKTQKSPLTAQNRSKIGVWIFKNGKKCQNQPRNGEHSAIWPKRVRKG